MTKDEALTLAFEALETSMYPQQKQLQAITAIKAALAQPERQWAGLTNEEQIQVAWSCGAMSADWLDFANSIEAKLKEKNI